MNITNNKVPFQYSLGCCKSNPHAPPLPSSGQRPLVFPLCTVNSFIVQTTRSQPQYELHWKECADCREKKGEREREDGESKSCFTDLIL